jgi:hypothetical protein
MNRVYTHGGRTGRRSLGSAQRRTGSTPPSRGERTGLLGVKDSSATTVGETNERSQATPGRSVRKESLRDPSRWTRPGKRPGLRRARVTSPCTQCSPVANCGSAPRWGHRGRLTSPAMYEPVTHFEYKTALTGWLIRSIRRVDHMTAPGPARSRLTVGTPVSTKPTRIHIRTNGSCATNRPALSISPRRFSFLAVVRARKLTAQLHALGSGWPITRVY